MRNCPLCESPVSPVNVVNAEVDEMTTAQVHRSCAEAEGYEYTDASVPRPPADEQKQILSEATEIEAEGLFDLEVRVEEMGGSQRFVVDNPFREGGVIVGDTIPNLFSKIQYKIDWELTRDELRSSTEEF